MNIKSPTFLLLAIFLIIPASGGILSNVFGSNMVLQRSPVSASLYGWSTNGDTITVAFNNLKKYQTQAGGDGAWSVSLDPVEAGGPYSILVISGSNASATVNLTNILFGDVYVCGGQSNMQFTVNEVFNASTELANADNYPQIRLFTVGQGTTSSSPLNELATIEQVWSVASHQALGSAAGAFQYFSAVCWFSALNIFKSFNSSVPLGLVSSNWGGTIIQAWSSSDALAQCPQSSSDSILSSPNKMAVKSEMYSEVKAGPPTTDSSVLWNAMIVPFLQMKVSAFLWYQAEANVGETDLYRCLFPAMINDWRAKWGLGDLPFIFAQLSPYTTDGPLPFWYSLADMRLAQTSALALPNVGMASTVDAGDTGSPFTNIHPRDKQVVGYRMSLSLLSFLYGVPNVIHSGPTLSSATIASPYPNVEVILNFLPTTIGSGLELRGASCPTNFTTYCSTWELGLSDGTWHVASASILNNVAVTLTIPSSASSASANVTAARYLYNDWPVATLYSSSTGLPANPFYFVFIP